MKFTLLNHNMDLQRMKKVNVYFISVTRPVFFMFLIYLTYLLIGSICFVTFESFEDIRSRNQSAQEIKLSRDIASTLMGAGFSKEAICLAFQQEKEVIKGTAKPKMVPWAHIFGEKVFFAFILITTIGYGNVSPSTQIGRLVTIAYTLFGMPIHVITMRLLSYEFRSLLRKVLKVGQKFGRFAKFTLIVAGGFFFIVFVALFILVPAYVFMHSDRWDYGLGVYFSFVSLTTIGLGDYVAVVSGEHLQDRLYSLYVVAMLAWLVFGLAFVFMAFNTLSYLLGVALMDKVDSQCRRRTTAKRRMAPLLDVIKDLNWNLVKFTPEEFKHADDIEQFKELLVENPQDVTHEKLLDIFRMMGELREQAYEDLSQLMSAGIPMTPIIESARDNLPDILSEERTTVTYSVQKTHGKPDGRGTESPSPGELQSLESAPELGSGTDEPSRESTTRFRFGSAVDLYEIGSATDLEAAEDEDAGKDEESRTADDEDEAKELSIVAVEKDSGPSQEEERNKNTVT